MRAVAIFSVCVLLAPSRVAQGSEPVTSEGGVDRVAADAIKEAITDLVFDTELRGTHCFLYTGQVVQDRPDEKPLHSGIFPFTAFLAVKAADDGKVLKSRFWCIKAAVVNGVYNLHGTSVDEIFDGETTWFSLHGGAVRRHDPKKGMPAYQRADPRLDPYLTLFAYPAGTLQGLSQYPTQFPFLRVTQFSSATDGLKEKRASLLIAPNHYGHFFIDEASGWRPTKFVVTEGSQKLEHEDANAEVVNFMRWKKDRTDNWAPEAGWHTQYTNGTKKRNRGIVHVSYQVLWVAESEIKPEWFEKSDLDSTPSVRLARVEEHLRRLQKIAPYDAPDQ